MEITKIQYVLTSKRIDLELRSLKILQVRGLSFALVLT